MKLAVLLLLLSVATFAPAQNPPARVSGGVMQGQLLTRVQPVYPQEARDRHISGAVVLRATIAADGTIASLQVLSGPDILAQAAWTAVKQWTYKPYLLNGRPTEVDTTITVNFNLGDESQPSTPSANARPVLTSVDLKGYVVHKVPPVYPSAARQAHISGSVVLRAILDTEGHVASLQVLSGPPELTDAALDAVRQWQYKPYLLNAVATEVETEITVNFQFG